MKKTAKRKRWQYVVLCWILCISIACIVCIYFFLPYRPLPDALHALKSDDDVTVQEEVLNRWFNRSYYLFKPFKTAPTRGFIFYPGGFVDPRAYASLAHAIAARGYLVVIVSIPLNLAEFGYRRADEILEKFREIDVWAIGGHSLGGRIACKYLTQGRYRERIKGIILWASRPSDKYRLDKTALKAISIHGTHDGLVTESRRKASRSQLPEDTVWVEIKGGNHTQFGSYDTSPFSVQPGDELPDISREMQKQQIISATVDFLDQL